MKKVIAVIAGLMLTASVNAQDSLFTYQHIFKIDSLSKTEIYDKLLTWCASRFGDANHAIKVQEKEGGLIAGKGIYTSFWKNAGKKDSIVQLPNDFKFDWLFEIKDEKVRFTISNVEIRPAAFQDYFRVTSQEKAPYMYMFARQSKMDSHYQLSKIYFNKDLDNFSSDIYNTLTEKKSDW